MPDDPRAPRRWRWWHLVVALGAVLVVAGLVASVTLRPRVSAWARAQTVTFLEDAFDSEVELGGLDVQLGTTFRVRGRDLVLRHKGRRDVPPLIVIASFDVATSLRHLFETPRRVDTVEVTGLQFNIPPRHSPDEERFPNQKPSAPRRDRAPASPSTPRPEAPERAVTPRGPASMVISHVSALEATMTIVPKDPSKAAKVWAIHALAMSDVAPDRAMPFSADIHNPLPSGTVVTSGTFGPWASGEPGLTPLSGAFSLDTADLGTIPGVGGTVQSSGTFTGILERIEATGSSLTPDFHLDYAGQPITLATTYTSVIDATNGNTWLDPVEIVLGAGTHLTSTGGIVKVTPDAPGRTIELETVIDKGRVEDILRLVVESPTPLMTGGLQAKATMLIPPGREPVGRKMRVEGSFSLQNARFTNNTIQDKIDELSRRGQGRPEATNIDNVLSNFSGRFRMRNGAVTFSALRFATRGAQLRLAGTYHLDGRLDFDGSIRLTAGVSQMVTGKKRVLLKVVDPLFRRDGATEFPLRIGGTVSKPEVGVDVKKTLRRALLRRD